MAQAPSYTHKNETNAEDCVALSVFISEQEHICRVVVLQNPPEPYCHLNVYRCLFYKPEIIEMGLCCQLLVGSVHLKSHCFRP